MWSVNFKILFFCLYALIINLANAQVHLYPAPKGIIASKNFEVKFNGKKAFVYHSAVPAAYCSFGLNGTAKVTVKTKRVIKQVIIRPLSLKIKPQIKNGEIYFSINKPCKLSIEINGSAMPLFLFANKVDSNIPAKGTPNLRFFAAGKVYQTNKIILKSNDVVYIQGGAYVKGSFFLDSLQNVHIYGNGVLDGGIFKKGEQRTIEINRCQNILVEGITIVDSKHWTVPCNQSSNITYKNIKIISNNDWDDGIDIVSSKNVLVDSCFIRTKDDCIAIKAGVNYYTKFIAQQSSQNIKVQNCVLWNGQWGNALEIGFETRNDTIKNIEFNNLDIIHVDGPEGCFTIHNGDRALITNVVYNNIRVEEASGWLLDFRILKSVYSIDTTRGCIQNISFNNISVKGSNFPYSQLLGFDEVNRIKDIKIQNLTIKGKKINSIYNGLMATSHCDDLFIK